MEKLSIWEEWQGYGMATKIEMKGATIHGEITAYVYFDFKDSDFEIMIYEHGLWVCG